MTKAQKVKYTYLVHCYTSEDAIVKGTKEQRRLSSKIDMRKLANHSLFLRFYYTDNIVHKR